MMAWANPLHPDAFPGLRKMEAEIVRAGTHQRLGYTDILEKHADNHRTI